MSTQAQTLQQLIAQYGSADKAMAAIAAQAETDNRAAQANIPMPASQPDADWQTRAAWLTDGQAIHGEMKTFLWPAMAAIKVGDQAEYHRQMDLIFKALRTFTPDEPPATQNA